MTNLFLFPDGTERTLPTQYKSASISSYKRAVETFGAIPVHYPQLKRFEYLGEPRTYDHAREYGAVPMEIDKAKKQLKAELNDFRWNRETSNIEWEYKPGEIHIVKPTIGRIESAKIGAKHRETVSFKTNDGDFINLSFADLAQLSEHVVDHIQACFERQNELEKIIDEAKTLDDLRNIDIYEGWPAVASDEV